MSIANRGISALLVNLCLEVLWVHLYREYVERKPCLFITRESRLYLKRESRELGSARKHYCIEVTWVHFDRIGWAAIWSWIGPPKTLHFHQGMLDTKNRPLMSWGSHVASLPSCQDNLTTRRLRARTSLPVTSDKLHAPGWSHGYAADQLS